MSQLTSLFFTVFVQVSLLALFFVFLHKLAVRRNAHLSTGILTTGTLAILATGFVALLPFPSWLQHVSLPQSVIGSQSTPSKNGEELATAPSNSSARDAPQLKSGRAVNEPISEASREGEIAETSEAHSVAIEEAAWLKSLGNSNSSNQGRKSLAWRWLDWMALFLISISGLGGIKLLCGLVSLKKLRKNSMPVRAPWVLELTDQIRGKIGEVRAVDVRTTSHVATAATIGGRQPVIFLSDDYSNWDGDYLPQVLAHELAHIRHRDFIRNLVAHVCTAFHFFNPLVHWLSSCLRMSQEFAADQLAISTLGNRETYVRVLAELALKQDEKYAKRLFFSPMFLPSGRTMITRIKMISTARSVPSCLNTWVVPVAALALSFLVCGLKPPAQEEQDRKAILFEQLASCSWLDQDKQTPPKSADDIEKIVSVCLSDETFKDFDLEDLQLLKALTHLDMSSTSIRDIDLLAVSRKSSLTHLDLHETNLAVGLPILAKLPNLKHLNLMDTKVVKTKIFAKMKRLEYLNLSNTSVVDLAPLSKLTSLKHLELGRLGELAREALGFCDRDLTPLSNLKSLEHLDLCYSKIDDLAFLRDLTALKHLDLNSTTIMDITSLGNLTKLNRLYLNSSTVSDLTPLKTLTSLTELGVGNTRVTDLSPIRGLIKLKLLDLESTGLVDFSQLIELEGLKTLRLANTVFKDLSVLNDWANLKELTLANSKVTDLSPLKGMNTLKKLTLDNTDVVDFTVIENFTALEELSLSETAIEDLTPLSKLVSLKKLEMHSTKVADLTALANMSGLEEIWAESSSVSDLSPLADLACLKRISLRRTSVSDIAPLSKSTGMTFLDISSTEIDDWEPLRNLVAMEVLRMNQSKIVDLSPLVGMNRLKQLTLQNSAVSDIAPLGRLQNLDFLSIWGCEVSDLTPLSGLTSLEWLGIAETRVTDISVVAELPSLTGLMMRGCPVSDFTPLSKASQLESLDIDDTGVTDLSPIEDLSMLVYLNIGSTNVTNEDAEEFRRQHPNVYIQK